MKERADLKIDSAISMRCEFNSSALSWCMFFNIRQKSSPDHNKSPSLPCGKSEQTYARILGTPSAMCPRTTCKGSSDLRSNVQSVQQFLHDAINLFLTELFLHVPHCLTEREHHTAKKQSCKPLGGPQLSQHIKAWTTMQHIDEQLN